MKNFIISLVVLLAIVTGVSLSRADGVATQFGIVKMNVGALGTTPYTIKSFCHYPGTAVSHVFIRRYASVATGAVLFTIKAPANDALRCYNLEDMLTDYVTGTSGTKGKGITKGLVVPTGGFYVDAITQTAGYTTFIYR